MGTGVSTTDRIGNGIVAGFIATLAISLVHEPVDLLTEAIGVDTPVSGLVFHFFVGTLLWGGVFGLAESYLPGPYWVRGVIFAILAACLVLFVVLPLSGAGLLGLDFDILAPIVVVAFHLGYGAALGAIYGKLIDTDEAREHDIRLRH